MVLAITGVFESPLAAQGRPRVEIVVPPPAARAIESAAVRTANVLTDSRTKELLRSGFPARIHYKVERWRVGNWFDDLRATREWDVVVRYDPLTERYRVDRVRAGVATAVGEFSSIVTADSAVGAVVPSTLVPPRRGERSYYAARVDVEMLSVSDLDEVERWLRGELKPAVRGERSPGTALQRGMRTILVRVLGGEKRRYVTRSGTFTP